MIELESVRQAWEDARAGGVIASFGQGVISRPSSALGNWEQEKK